LNGDLSQLTFVSIQENHCHVSDLLYEGVFGELW